MVKPIQPTMRLVAALTFCFAGIAATLVSTWIITDQASNDLRAHIVAEIGGFATNMADRLDQGMYERWRDIKVLAQQDVLRDPATSVDAKRSVLQRLQQIHPEYALIAIISPEGRVLATSKHLTEGADVSKRDIFLKGLRRPSVLDVHDAQLLAEPNSPDPLLVPRFVDLVAPVKADDGVPTGVIAAHLRWAWANEVERSLRESLPDAGRGIEIRVLAHDGRVLLGPPLPITAPSAAPMGRLMETPRETLLRDDKTYVSSTRSTRGYNDYPGLGWEVLVDQKTADAMEPVAALRRQALLSGGAITLAMVLFGWFAGAALARPMSALADLAKQIGSGIPLDGRASAFRETQAVADALVRASAELRSRADALTALNVSLERRVAERTHALSESEARHRAYFENAAESLFDVRVAAGGEFLYDACNPKAMTTFSLAKEDYFGRPSQAFMGKQQARFRNENFQTCLALDAPHSYVEEVQIGEQTHTFDVILVPVQNPATGRVERILGSARDVTDLRATEEALRQSQKMEAIGQLTGGVAHDFNNLLTAIMGSLRMLRKRIDLNEKTLPLIEGGEKAAERGAALTQRLLAFARRQDLKPDAVNVAELIAGMRDLLARSLGPTIEVKVRMPETLAAARVDANQLELAILNLTVNSRDAMPLGGTVRITGYESQVAAGTDGGLKTGDYVVVEVADTGGGMDSTTMRRATEPFFTTKGVGKGTGLGLAMVHGLAEQSGGRVVVQSRLGSGTIVEIWLPRASAPPVGLQEVGQLPDHAASPCTILLVDDDIFVKMSTSAILEDQGHTVLEASSGLQALDILAAGGNPDLVITDYAMPGMNGCELVSRLKERRPDLPVMLITGYADAALDPTLPRLSKPFHDSDLQAMIAKLTAKRDAASVVAFKRRS